MKKILLILVTFSLFFTGCEEKLDLDPHQSLSENQTFSKAEDFETVIRGVYREMIDYGAMGGYKVIFPGVSADNLIQCKDGRLTLGAVQNWNLSSDHYYPGSFWQDSYDAINIANKLIKNGEGFEAENEDGEMLIQNTIGEAYALRAILHFDLVRIFGESYSQAGADAPGVPYMTEPLIGNPERGTVKDNYQNIVDDLKTAINHLNMDNGKTRINKSSAQAFLSKVYFYMGNYENAITYADSALQHYELNTREEFGQIWTDETNTGVIFKLSVVEKQADYNWGYVFSQTGSDGTKSEYVCDYELYQMFAGDDIRLDEYIVTSTYNGTMYNHIQKYMGRPGENATPNLVDIKVLRTAEILLTRAESYYEEGNEKAALDDLDKLRDMRYESYTGGESGQDLLDAIRAERRIELAFEGDRWYELKRRNEDITRANYGDHADGTGDSYPEQTLSKDAYQWLFPIPNDELNANDNINQSDQNPGY